MKQRNLTSKTSLKPSIVQNFVFLILILTSTFCSQDITEPDLLQEDFQCEITPVINNYSRVSLIQAFDEAIIQGIASIDVPNNDGAMGRNKNGYFHVRFQMGISSQADYAIYNNNTQALDYAIKAIEYAFEHQLADGSFDYVVPADLANQTPTDADLTSGVSFFLSSLGLALNDFDESNWYNSLAITTYKDRVELLRPKINSAAQWLLTKKAILETADQNAPNRLFFNGLAFYSLGKWLNDENLKTVGVSFAYLGISKKKPQGYFLEGNGWDSSYQGVALNVGFNLYSIIPNNIDLKTVLWDCLSCASNWQKSRILESGEISTKGNVRVYPGGESFLGQEKQVDWIKSMVAMFVMGFYGNDISYTTKANEIKGFYN